jgi:hypothetical protein
MNLIFMRMHMGPTYINPYEKPTVEIRVVRTNGL